MSIVSRQEINALPMADTSRRWGQFLYAVEFTDGRIKIGRTKCPRIRITVFDVQARREGCQISGVLVAASDIGAAAEQALRRECEQIGQLMPGRREWFVHADYARVVDATRRIAKETLERSTSAD